MTVTVTVICDCFRTCGETRAERIKAVYSGARIIIATSRYTAETDMLTAETRMLIVITSVNWFLYIQLFSA